MDEEKTMLYSNGENFQRPPLKDMTNTISKFSEKSKVDDKTLAFNNFNENKTDLLNVMEKELSNSKSQLEKNKMKHNDEKTEFVLLSEKDLSDIDFEISKDMFEDIKIKEEDITGVVEKASSQLAIGNIKNDIDFKFPFLNENKVTLLDSEIKKTSEKTAISNFNDDCQMQIMLEESMEILCSPESEKIVEEKAEKNEIKRIMTELQATSIRFKNDHASNGCLESKDKESNVSFSSDASLHLPKSVENSSTDEKRLKDSDFNNKENISSSAFESTMIEDKTVMILEKEIGSKPYKENNKSINCNDSIRAVIESVIKASLQQDNEDIGSSETDQEEKNDERDGKKRKLDLSTENCAVEKKVSYGVFEVVVPLIGKSMMQPGNDAPFTQRYDLARKRNELRAKSQKNDPGFPVPSISFEEWRKKKESRTKEEVAADEKKKRINAIQLAKTFTKIAIRILLEYEKDEPNEAAMIKYFRFFELAPASPLSLLYAPHFVHTMMLCRGDEQLSPNLRRAANECYDKCHALFPIPEGYNFETVYTSEVKKNIPDELDKLSDLVLDYGDYDSSDFEDNASDCASDSDKDWE